MPIKQTLQSCALQISMRQRRIAHQQLLMHLSHESMQ